MKVVITSATEKESCQLNRSLKERFSENNESFQITFHESGVGILSSCFSITKLIFEQKPDLILQAGIAGSFTEKLIPGKVVVVKEESIADQGVEENGKFLDVFDLQLQPENFFPFTERKLANPFLKQLNYLDLLEVTGVTINEITTRPARIEILKTKYQAEIESMEGGALHYCCLQNLVPFIQFRAISNYIGERDKSKWNFTEAFNNLSSTITSYLLKLYKTSYNLPKNSSNNEIYNRIQPLPK